MPSRLQALERKVTTVKQFSGTTYPGGYEVSRRLGILPWTSLMGRFAPSICNQHQVVYVPFPEVSTFFSCEKLMLTHTNIETEVKFILTDIFLRFSSLQNQLGFCTHTCEPSCRKGCALTVKFRKRYLWHLSKTGHGSEGGRERLWLSKHCDYLL